MKFVAIDFETTGLTAQKDRVIEIGLVRFSDRFEIEEEFSTLINPGRDVGRTDIHGITATMLDGAPTFSDIAFQVCDFISGSILVAHNKKFDLDFLTIELTRAGIEPPEFDALCTIELIRSVHPASPRRLHDACRFLGLEPENAHQALSDARMAALVAMTILRDSGYPAMPSPTHISVPVGSANPIYKTREMHAKSQPESYLAGLVASLPETTLIAGKETVAANEYLNLLDRVIEDRIIDNDEAQLLTMLAADLGLCRAALADGKVSDSERRDIQAVAEALGLEGWEELLIRDLHEVDSPPSQARSLPPGTKVCFTGEMDLTRVECEELASQKGLSVCPRVTKDVEVLVVADPRTQSSKAQKARKYGARIMSERAFFREIEKYPDVGPIDIDDDDLESFEVGEIVIQIGGRVVPMFGFAMDELTTRRAELTSGFSDMLNHVSLLLLEPTQVNERIAELEGITPRLTGGAISVSESCDAARGILLDLWSHVRSVAGQWEEPTHSMQWGREQLRQSMVDFFASSQAIDELRQDRTEAANEIASLVKSMVETVTRYEPQVHHSALYKREKVLRDAGAIPKDSLHGLSLVITGDFAEFEREQSHRAILERGGKSPGSVSGRTYAVIAGESPGWAKIERARTLGTPVVGYAEFLTILDKGELPGVPKKERSNPGKESSDTENVIETFVCGRCGEGFSRIRMRGRKPRECPECRGVGDGKER
jgi:DNA polymerase-3 subunit epsilon